MRVPSVVESGKQPHVILDCDYDLTENEGRQVNHLKHSKFAFNSGGGISNPLHIKNFNYENIVFVSHPTFI